MLIYPSDICPPFPHVHRSTDADKYYTKANVTQMNRQEQSHPEPITPHQLGSVLFFSLLAAQDPFAQYDLLMEIWESNLVASRHNVRAVIWPQLFLLKLKIKNCIA